MAFLNHPGHGLDTINKSTAKKIHPGPFDLTESLRFDKLYIDDIAEGIPLIPNRMVAKGVMVNCPAVEIELMKVGIL